MLKGINRRTFGRSRNAVTGKHAVLNFVDLGAGSAKRIRTLAKKHPKKSFVAVDINQRYKGMEGAHRKLGNLRFEHSDAFEYLKKQPSGSIGIINLDVFSAEFQPLKEKHYDDDFIINRKFLAEVRRVLNPRGRVYFTLSRIYLERATNLLKECGFNVKAENLEKLEQEGRITSTSRRIEIGKEMAKASGEASHIIRIEAIKSGQ